MPTRSFTAAQYRALRDPIRDEGPWGGLDNPSHPFYPSRRGIVRLIGLHITAGITDLVTPDTGAEAVVSNWAANRNNTGASWHGTADSDSIVPTLPDSYTAWVQGVRGYDFNSCGVGIEQARASTNWNSPATPQWNLGTLRNVAVWCAPRVIRYGLPIRLVRDRDEVQRLISAGKGVGLAYHADLDPVNRTDPGIVTSAGHRLDTYPVDTLLGMIEEEVALRKGSRIAPTVIPSTPLPPVPTKLTVDGQGGTLTTLRLQDSLATTKDGIVHGQITADAAHWPNLLTIAIDETGPGDVTGKALQAALANTGWYTGRLDGLLGQGSAGALQGALAAEGLYTGAADKYVGPGTMAALQRKLNTGGRLAFKKKGA